MVCGWRTFCGGVPPGYVTRAFLGSSRSTLDSQGPRPVPWRYALGYTLSALRALTAAHSGAGLAHTFKPCPLSAHKMGSKVFDFVGAKRSTKVRTIPP